MGQVHYGLYAAFEEFTADFVDEQSQNDGNGKAHNNGIQADAKRVLIRRPKYSDLKNWMKYLKPTHLLPVMPSTGEKSRKAICAPYMARYMNTIYQIRAGSSIKADNGCARTLVRHDQGGSLLAV